jgi:hypothetical protein
MKKSIDLLLYHIGTMDEKGEIPMVSGFHLRAIY